MWDVVVIGAGVVGCAAARELARHKLRILVLEAAHDVAEGTTKANSAIVHAGFDAEADSIKARTNVQGNALFESWSRELEFEFKRIGSLVTCFYPEGIETLHDLKRRGEYNGVQGLQMLDRDAVREMEPNLSEAIQAALWAPSAGITCPYGMTYALAENAAQNGVEFIFNSRALRIERADGGLRVMTDTREYAARCVVNAAGLYADELHNTLADAEAQIHIIPRRGEYILLERSAGSFASHTLFTLPTRLGKGVLITLTVDGNLLVGPNAQDIPDKDDVDTTQEGLEQVMKEARQMMPELPLHKAITCFAGLRAHAGTDFFIGESAPGCVSAVGIESPGLTAAPAIALELAQYVRDYLQPEKRSGFIPQRKGIRVFRTLSDSARAQLCAQDAGYSRVLCRCEMVTEAEVLEAIRRKPGATSLDGVKRRVRAGMGRCQGGFCGSRVMALLARELNIPEESVTLNGPDSPMLCGRFYQMEEGSHA